MTSTASARAFLDRLEEYLGQALPVWPTIAEALGLSGDSAERLTDGIRIAFPEVDFLQRYIVNNISRFLIDKEGLDEGKAKQALLAEGADHLEEVSGTPCSLDKYPFKKSIVESLNSATHDWWCGEGGTYNSYPDIALRSPCKFRVVIEGKLFRGKTEAAARKALVDGIFETSFYRGLPRLLRDKDADADSYEYGCFLAYDASPEGALWKAWQDINEEVRTSIWNTLFTHVLVLRRKFGPAIKLSENCRL
jgi:hypothetical protein